MVTVAASKQHIHMIRDLFYLPKHEENPALSSFDGTVCGVPR